MIGIAGLGFVGGSLARALEMNGRAYRGYDPAKGFTDMSVLADCDIVFVVVGTPKVFDDLEVESVYRVVAELDGLVADGTIIAIKSTVPPGTNDELAAMYPRLRFASVPEFLVQDRALETFLHPDRVVIGARDDATRTAIADVITDAIEGSTTLFFCLPREAELLKLSANVLLASKVAVANALADICEAYDVDWANIQRGVGLDSRIGQSHLTVTEERGFGGACFPKDLRGLIAAAERAGLDPTLLKSIESYNDVIRSEVPR